MSTTPKPDETTAGLKLVLSNGQKINLGLQSGSLAMLVWIGVQATSFVSRVIDEAEATRAEISTLGSRLDTMEGAIKDLAENSKRIDAVEAENTRLRADQAQARLDIAATMACARDRKKCP